ncbi:hypothetical protein YA0002_09630 [Pseudomonas cichorii]|uniref:Tc toxin subunit A n=1 Tax=Pseudomonas cichorii TaxID=36746 RepID=UPI0018E5C1F5|nr:Tc toxin subunit A [Pseudomonas cichorii]MBI6853025.1 hypothetical protein [Pseudomonas cichorii]
MADQPFSLLKNLAKAEATTPELAEGKLTFVSALQEMGITSVFDIVRRAKPAFVRELARLSDANGELAYENARCYATQIVRLYRNQLVSSGRTQSITRRTGVRSLVEIGPSFPNLFKENWDLFCKVGAIEAKDSPAAYLTSLYRFAKEELEGSSEETNRIHLEERRPDLKDLLIDQQSTFTPVPTLQIVNQVLTKAIDAYVDTVEADKDKTIYQLVAEKKHPFLFPYNFHHQQIMLGLAGKKPMLGELSYQISLEILGTETQKDAYGALQHNSTVAQIMMSGLSPEQQAIVLAPALPPAPPPAETAEETLDDQEDLLTITRFFKASYGVNYIHGAANPLDSLSVFIEKTGLTSDSVEALLAVHHYAPYVSPNVLGGGHNAIGSQATAGALPTQYGACYVNGPTDQAPLALNKDTEGKTRLVNTSLDRFDRLQRMIRLQRWMDIPFAELDTLIMAVIRSEGETNTGQVLTLNLMRALGTYRYLNKRYSIEPEEFAGFFHKLSAYASKGRLPAYDRVFNHPVLFDMPMVMDGKGIWMATGDTESNRSLAQICVALGLEFNEDSLWNIMTDTKAIYGETLKRNLSMMSSMYRQTRIASMFDLPAPACRALIDVLGGEPYRHQIAKGALKQATTENKPPTPAPDILDILMQLDWAVNWLNETGRDVWTLRRQLAIDPTQSAVPQSLLDQLDKLGKDAGEAALTKEQLTPLNLPASDDSGTAIDWWGTVLAALIETHGLVKALPLTLDDNATTALNKLLAVQLGPVNLAPATKETIQTRLGEFLFKGYVIQHRLVEGLLQANAGLPLDRCETVMRWAGTSADVFLGKVMDAAASASFKLPLPADSQAVIDSLKTLLRYTEVNQQLGLSAQALRTFLVNPKWLHTRFAAPLPLSLASLHALDRYRNWRDNCGHPETALLSYLAMANSSAATEWAQQLARLINWSSTEIAKSRAFLVNRICQSMHQVDWLSRMQNTSTLTGLSTTQLQAATDLTSASTTDEWKKVGDAVMGASR